MTDYEDYKKLKGLKVDVDMPRVFSVSIGELCTKLSCREYMSRDNVFDFIIQLEHNCEDEDLLRRLAKHFNKEVKALEKKDGVAYV